MQPARVLRGGGWINNDDNDTKLQSAARGAAGINDNNDDDDNGFRAARTLVARVHRLMGWWSERGTVPPSSGPGA